MPVQISISAEGKNEALDALLSNTNGGRLKIYSGAAPGPDNAATGTLLANLALGNPAFDPAVAGSATAAAITDALASAPGTAGYGRLTKADTTTGVVEIAAGGSWVTTFANVANQGTTNVAHGLGDGVAVEVFAEGAGTLPAELSSNTTYYTKNAAASVFQLEASIGGGVIDLTTDGTGTIRLKLATTGIALASSDGTVAAGVTVSVASFVVTISG